ncbi:MAG TPA: RteC domain-containing protein, partial [Mucilaginibacter sp.]|nr:RteC domain-containing protein [Mucilaginibacter sp.]
INALKGYPVSTQTEATSKLQWTGEAINIVELAYGIWLTGQLNHGNATISEIIAFFEEKFTIKIGRPYRRWTEISQRKQVSATKYIDQLKSAIDKRIDEELTLKRKKRRDNQANS